MVKSSPEFKNRLRLWAVDGAEIQSVEFGDGKALAWLRCSKRGVVDGTL
jgi:hypothetical protein